VILARLDRLENRVKGIAQVGSVIGRSFAVRLLAEVMEEKQAVLEVPLTALQQAELAFPRRTTELEYVFKHVTGARGGVQDAGAEAAQAAAPANGEGDSSALSFR
jgi:hypothetical protein